MNNQLAVYASADVALPPAEEMQQAWKLAQALVTTRFLPTTIDTPAKAVAIWLKGRELGLPFMLSMSSIHIIEGKPTASAELMRALAFQRIKGFGLKVLRADDKACSIEFRRDGSEPFVYTYTIEDAMRAGDARKNTYQKHPGPMLVARCTAQGLRLYAPDATMGVYAREEFDGESRHPAVTLEPRDVQQEPEPTPEPAVEVEVPKREAGAPREQAQEPPASGASTTPPPVAKKAASEQQAAGPRDYAAEFKATIEAHYKTTMAGDRLVRAVNAMSQQAGLGIKVESLPKRDWPKWKDLAEAAAEYVAGAGSGTAAAATESAPPASTRWMGNTTAEDDAALDAAARAAADAETPDEQDAADANLATTKRVVKNRAQEAIYASAQGLIQACEKAAKKFAKTRPEKEYIVRVGDVVYFVDGDVMDACGIQSNTGLDIAEMTPETRATIRRAVEAEAA